MKIPYGIADFYALRTEGHVYVDRTDRIRTVEEAGKALLFIRPRRFGKSLWLRTLACYYDLRYKAEHEILFGDLAVGRDPTPLAHRYFVLEWDFSDIDPDPPPLEERWASTSRVGRIAHEIHRHVNTSLEVFLLRYREHLPEPFELGGDAFSNLGRLLGVIEQTPYRLYLLVDEYDNFANEVMTSAPEDYDDLVDDLVHTDGPFKRLFKWVKAAMRGRALERLFLTGVSPVVMSDVTSGLNMARNVYLHPQLSDLCGFREDEVRDLLEAVLGERAAKGAGTVSASEALSTMREWYDGYRFAVEAKEQVYNPTLALYFLLHLWEQGTYPRQMLDSNLAADEDKLEYFAQVASGRQALIEVIRGDKPLEIERLEERFTLRAMLERSAQDVTFLGSFLYYFGMLTLAGETARRNLLLSPPNQAVRKLYADRILQFLLPRGEDRTASRQPVWNLMEGGVIEPLLDFVEETIFATFSNRDATWANELTVKTVFLTLLWNDLSYVVHSEPELDHRYADLCLLRRGDAKASSLVDLLFEFKRLPLAELGMSGEAVKSATREDLARLDPVKKALDKAETQLASYRRTLEKRQGSALELRAWAVVALGFERLVARDA